MRILANAIDFAPSNGINLRVLQTSRAFSERGHQVSVIGQGGGELEPRFRECCESVHVSADFVHAPLGPSDLRRPGHVARWIRNLALAVAVGRSCRPDVVCANDAGALPWALATAALTRAGVVCHLPNYLEESLGRQRRFYAKHVRAFVAASSFACDRWIAKGLPTERVHRVPNGVDAFDYPFGGRSEQESARERLDLPPDAFVALFVGRCVEDKGVHVLLEAWRLLGLDPDRGRLVVVGPVWPPAYGDRLRELATASVEYRPMTADVVTPMHAADVVAVPSIWDEPFGRVVVEGLATGRPVVASRTGGIPEILTGELSTFLVERGDPEALADRLSSLIGWRDAAPSLAETCVAHVREHFSLADVVDRLERVLEGAAAGGRA